MYFATVITPSSRKAWPGTVKYYGPFEQEAGREFVASQGAEQHAYLSELLPPPA